MSSLNTILGSRESEEKRKEYMKEKEKEKGKRKENTSPCVFGCKWEEK